MGAAERLDAPATGRNRDVILAVLRRVLPADGVVLEVASGTGQHAAHFAAALPGLVWQPTDRDPTHRASIAAWTEGLSNVRPPLDLDTTRRPWPVAGADAMVCINMIHIAPWEACLGLLEGAAEVLPAGAPLVLYGPYRRGGAHTAPSNEAFDADLRRRDSAWGVRDLEAVETAAAAVGFTVTEVVEMPANNLTVVFRRAEA